jgi:hypothetical protein
MVHYHYDNIKDALLELALGVLDGVDYTLNRLRRSSSLLGLSLLKIFVFCCLIIDGPNLRKLGQRISG